MYWYNLKKSIFNLGMLLSVVLVVVIQSQGMMFGDLFHTSSIDVLTAVTYPMAMTYLIPFACVFPILPYAFSFVDEYNSKYIFYIRARMSKNRYIMNKLLFTALSGGVALLVPCFIIFIIICCTCEGVTVQNCPGIYDNMIWKPYLFVWGGRFIMLVKLLSIFLFGCEWALVALAVSAAMPNRYVAFVIPFIIYQLLWLLLPDSLWEINPIYLFRADYYSNRTIAYPFMIHSVYISLSVIANVYFLRRRISNE